MENDRNGSLGAERWTAATVVSWLLDEGRLLAGVEETVRQLGDRLVSCGAPVLRLRLSMRTLHPLITAISCLWERDAGEIRQITATHGLEGRIGYVGSPLEIMGRTRAPFRKRLSDPLSAADHVVLHELKASGATDYLGLPMAFSNGAAASLVITTDRDGGFSDEDISGFGEIASVFAPIVEVFSTRRISLAVAEAYLGPRTGRLVLDGQITRGHVETIDAAILVSDIRDWTGLSGRLSAEDALALVNSYFEIVSEPVEANGGEILKFIGDGVLAIFPAKELGLSAEAACEKALAAARQSLRGRDVGQFRSELNFGIGLHFGEVLYGNVGSTTRLDFTVLGQAVNIASRIEGLCGRLNEPLLVSRDFADRLAKPSRTVAREQLKGLPGTHTVLVPASID